jgi:hypothetical protein
LGKIKSEVNIMWRFTKLEPGVPERDPHEAEFFRLKEPAEDILLTGGHIPISGY